MAGLFFTLLADASFILPAVAQLSGTVGPLTPTTTKAAKKVCNIMDYGGKASATADNGAAIQAAWDACKTGGQVYIPEGDYGLSTWVTLKNGQGASINLEGTIYRVGTAGGNMIMIRDSHDLEFYSASSKGAIQGYGYEFHKDNTYGPRILRSYKCTDFSVHDIALVDSPAFHLVLDTCTNAELYNMVVRGGNRGGLDGIDIWSTNIWVHDVEVTNKDECVTVKSPSDHILIEQVHCNWSGGCAMGSLGSGVVVHDIEYRNVYTHHANQMLMDQVQRRQRGRVQRRIQQLRRPQQRIHAGPGLDVELHGHGGRRRDPVLERQLCGMAGHMRRRQFAWSRQDNCPARVPCTDVSVTDFHVWTEKGSKALHGCQNAYGEGSCLRDDDGNSLAAFSSTVTLSTETDYTYATMASELTTGLGLTASIAVPTFPASFFPGLAPVSPILGAKAAGVAADAVVPTGVATPASSASEVRETSA